MTDAGQHAGGDALEQAQALVNELLEAARTGAIIPIRLPGQVEAIALMLEQARAEQAERERALANAAPPDMEGFLKEQSAFMSHAIHELRTPMTSIRGYSDMLGNPAMGTLNEMQQQFIDTVKTNARRMEGLLTDVSDVSKLRAGTLRTNIKMELFKNVAMMVEKATRPTAEQMGKTLTLEIPSGLPLLEVDGELIAKALVKLVENALRYTPAEGGEVTLLAEGMDGNRLRIEVRDNGIGMSPEEIAQLGTIYFRADNDHVRSFKGSGLGIPVAYGIFRLHGGTIDVESTPGTGTRFSITLKGMG